MFGKQNRDIGYGVLFKSVPLDHWDLMLNYGLFKTRKEAIHVVKQLEADRDNK
jgi:hypothetical protein